MGSPKWLLPIPLTLVLTLSGDPESKGNAKRIYTSVVVGGCANTLALYDSESEIHLTSPGTFAEVARAMLSPSKHFKTLVCNVSITSYIQDRSPITRHAWVDATFQRMTQVIFIHLCVPGRFVQVDTSTPLGLKEGLPVSDNKLAVIDSRGTLPCLCLFPTSLFQL